MEAAGGPGQQPQDLWELLECLGKGSYGSVFKGREKATGQLYAIKVMALVEEARKTIDFLRNRLCFGETFHTDAPVLFNPE